MKKKLLLPIALILFFNPLFSQNQNDRIEAASGKVIGMTSGGGSKGHGVIYQYNPTTGNDTVPVSLSGSGNNFGQPCGSLIKATNGRFYGMTFAGGTNNDGVIFSYNPNTLTDSILVNFNGLNGMQPYGDLLQASNGLLYGMTSAGGTANSGVLFSYDIITGKDSVLVNFSNANGSFPLGSLVQATNGLLYGITTTGSTNNGGVLFSYNISPSTYNILYHFSTSVGQGSPMQASNGLLYLTTHKGGASQLGSLCSYNIATTVFTTLLSFTGPNGNNLNILPNSTEILMQATNGLLYGMTPTGGTNNDGVLYSFDPVTNHDSVLVNFSSALGISPFEKLVQSSNGMLYSGTTQGGTLNDGVIFRYNPITGKDSVLLNLNGANGQIAFGTLLLTNDSTSYYMTYAGGKYNNGVLARFNQKARIDTVLINFGGNTNNNGNLVKASNGMLYGVTQIGGKYNIGTIFEYNPNTGADTILVNFNDTNGASPQGNLLQAKDGRLYGMARAGGTFGDGTLFRYNILTGQDTVLLNFNDTNGQWPYFALIQGKDGLLYGQGWVGGTFNDGVLFSYNPVTYKDSILVSYDDTNGHYGFSNLVQMPNGMIYGATNEGGSSNLGVLFRFNPATGQDTVLLNFNGIGGSDPAGDLVMDTVANLLYGTTEFGGSHGNGVLYKFNLSNNAETVLVDFNGANGSDPITGNLIKDSASGRLYGTTSTGGQFNYGVLYRYDPITAKDTVLLSFDSVNGSSPSGLVFLKNTTLGVNEIAKVNDAALIYPNPFRDVTNVIFNDAGEHYIELYDINGKQLRRITANGLQYKLYRNGLAAGVYTIKIFDSNKLFMASAKIIVQ